MDTKHEILLAKARERYWKNRERELIRMRRWSQENRGRKTEYARQYRKTKIGREATLRAVRKYESSHPIRRRAWNLSIHIDKKPCIICGDTKVHKHHPDPTKAMDIIFLCPLHHKQLHSGRLML